MRGGEKRGVPMNDRLDLRLDKKEKKGINASLVYFLLALSILLGAVSVGFLLSGRGGGSPAAGDPTGSKLKDLALKLERRDLSEAAARIWTDYLKAAGIEAGEAARIWYRIGKLYQDTGDYDRAIEAYYRSESAAPIESLQGELSRRTTECYQRLGMFSSLDDELKDRTSMQGVEKDEEIIAEIGDWKITESRLKMLMEEEVEMAIAKAAPGLTPENRNAQKEKLLESVADRKNMRKWLENYIAEELIYRRAMELGLYQKKNYVDTRERMERELLVQEFLRREYDSKISITLQDLRDYYEDHRERFAEDDGEAPPFEEVKDRVYAAFRAEEERKVQGRIMEDLMSLYDVVIHSSKFGENN